MVAARAVSKSLIATFWPRGFDGNELVFCFALLHMELADLGKLRQFEDLDLSISEIFKIGSILPHSPCVNPVELPD